MKIALLRHNKVLDGCFDAIASYLRGTKHAFVDSNLVDWKKHMDADVFIGIGVEKPAFRGKLAGEVIKYVGRHANKRYMCIEISAFNNFNREQHYGIGWDGQCGYGVYMNEGSPSDRFESLGISYKGWRTPSESAFILFTLQLPWDSAVYHDDYVARVDTALQALLKHSTRQIVLKTHPLYDERKMNRGRDVQKTIVDPFENIIKKHLSNDRVVKYPDKSASMKEILQNDDIHCVVSFNSNSLTDAIIYGVPGLALDRGAYAWPMCETDISQVEDPFIPDDRSQWLFDLAYTQWKPGEMGEAVKRLGL